MSTIISHSKKFIFFHNYKVAGSSISNVLSKYEPHYWIRTVLRAARYKTYHPALANFTQHASAIDVRKLVDPETFDSYYKFTFVRNPWDWQVSLYHYMLQKKNHFQHDLIKGMNFEDYIDWRVNHNLKTQCQRFKDSDGNTLVDFIGRFENLEDDFGKVCDLLSIERRLPHKNPSKHQTYRDYYNDRTRELVRDAFADDIALFDYDF